jgi:hypothetical protein
MRNGRALAWRLALLGQFLLASCSSDRLPALEQLVRDLGVAGPELRLVIFVAVPIEAEPAHPVEDRVDRVLGRARLVGILDAQQELAAVVAGEQPVEQRRARARRCAGSRSARARKRVTTGLLLALKRAFLFSSCCNATDERP